MEFVAFLLTIIIDPAKHYHYSIQEHQLIIEVIHLYFSFRYLQIISLSPINKIYLYYL